jgi:autotransporter-associated beta strand protein
MFGTWFPPFVQRNSKRNKRSRPTVAVAKLQRQLRLEALEDRLAPATHTWTGAVSGSWTNNANWLNNSPSGDNSADLVFPSNAMNFTNTNDIAAAFSVESITFSGNNSYTIGGTAITLNAGGILLDNTVTTATDSLNFDISLGLAQTWTVTNGTATLAVGGVLSATAGAGLTKAGSGTLALTANNAPTFQGGVTLTSGILSVGSNTALGTAQATLDGGTLQASSAVSLGNLIFVSAPAPAMVGGSSNITFTGPVTLGSGATLIVNNTGTTTFAAALAGAGSLTVFAGTGTVVLPVANNTYTGDTTLASGTLSLGDNLALGGAGTLNFSGGTLLATVAITLANRILVNAAASATTTIGGSNNVILTGPIFLLNNTTPLTVTDTGGVTFQGSVTGPGGLTEAAGTGTVLLLVMNTYSGTTTLTSGILVIGDPSALGTGPLVLNGGNFQSNGTVTLTNLFTVGGPATVGGSNSLTFAGAGTLNTGSVLTVNNSATTTFSAVLSGGGGVTDAGTGTLILAAANAYTGPTLINMGTLQLGVANAIPSGSAVTVASAGTVDLNDFNDAIGSLAGAGNVSLGNGILSSGANNTSTTFSGQISGAGGLTKAGSGTFILTGNNNYTGPTTVLAGALIVNGAQTGSNVAVSSGATLGGAGTLGSITAAGIVSPGGPGTAVLRSGNVVFNAGSMFTVKLNGTTAGTGFDQLNVSGTANLTANPTLSISAGFAANVGDTFTIIMSTNGLTGTFSGLAENATIIANGQTFRINYGANAATLTRTVSATTTVVASSVNPSVFGQPVTFTATVTPVPGIPGTPTGTVTFRDGTNVLGTGTLNNGVATFTTTASLSVGAHAITTVYNGDNNFAGSTSLSLTQTVNQASTTSTVTGSPNPASVGQSVTFTATVTANAPGAGTPTGTVSFRDGVTLLGTAALDSTGRAFLPTSSLAAGAHTITVVYSGDSNFATSTSQPFFQTVFTPTMTTLSSSPNPSVFGQSVTFLITVAAQPPASGTPTGTVTLRDGTTILGTATLSGGTGILTTSTLTTGSHSITATYNGDSTFASSTVGPVSQAVNPASTITTLSSSINPSAPGQSVTFTAIVTTSSVGSGIPSGTVTFSDGTTALGTGTLDSSGRATFQTSSLAQGPHVITATYSGSTDFQISTSSALTQTVQTVQPATTITLSSSPNPAVFGQPVTFTATVTTTVSGLGTPTGTVTFMEGNTTLGTGSLNASGIATFTSATLSVGSHAITARYNGDGTFAANTSSVLTETVNQASSTTTLSSSPNPSTSGQSVTFTATVRATAPGAGTPTGTVTFQEGSTVLGSSPLVNGTATFQSTSLSVASHQVMASYNGDANFRSSASAALTQTVNQAAPTGTPNQKFVIQVYRDLLGRDPDPDGLTHFSSLLDMNQATRSQVVQTIHGSPEARTRQVQNLFQMFLGRPADPVGLDLSIRFLNLGGSFFTLEAAIVGSTEYFQRAGRTNNGFLTAVYRDALGRAVDSVGDSLGSQALASGTSTEKLAEVVFTSPEGLQDLVQSFYSQFLHRAAESAAVSASTTALQQRLQQQATTSTEEEDEDHKPAAPVGASVDDLVGVIVGSDEYFGRL